MLTLSQVFRAENIDSLYRKYRASGIFYGYQRLAHGGSLMRSGVRWSLLGRPDNWCSVEGGNAREKDKGRTRCFSEGDKHPSLRVRLSASSAWFQLKFTGLVSGVVLRLYFIMRPLHGAHLLRFLKAVCNHASQGENFSFLLSSLLVSFLRSAGVTR